MNEKLLKSLEKVNLKFNEDFVSGKLNGYNILIDASNDALRIVLNTEIEEDKGKLYEYLDMKKKKIFALKNCKGYDFVLIFLKI